MKLQYTSSDMCLRHYLWTVDRRKDNDAHHLDAQVLDILQGYEVLMFANAFLNRYVPGHTIHHLHNLEHSLLEHLPNYIVTKRQIANWLAENNPLFTSETSLKNSGLEYEV